MNFVTNYTFVHRDSFTLLNPLIIRLIILGSLILPENPKFRLNPFLQNLNYANLRKCPSMFSYVLLKPRCRKSAKQRGWNLSKQRLRQCLWFQGETQIQGGNWWGHEQQHAKSHCMREEGLQIGFEDRFAKGVAVIVLWDKEENKVCNIELPWLCLLVSTKMYC